MLGAVQKVVMCVPLPAAPGDAICPAGFGVATQDAFVINPAFAESFTAAFAPLDLASAGALWFLSAGGLLLIWATAQTFGVVRKQIPL